MSKKETLTDKIIGYSILGVVGLAKLLLLFKFLYFSYKIKKEIRKTTKENFK